MELQKLEMIPCPRCGQPFPLRRKELGYNYCVNCSTEKHRSCIIEGSLDGDGDDTVHATLHIVSWEEANAINRIQRGYCSSDEYDGPDMRTTENLEDPEYTTDNNELEETEEEVEDNG